MPRKERIIHIQDRVIESMFSEKISKIVFLRRTNIELYNSVFCDIITCKEEISRWHKIIYDPVKRYKYLRDIDLKLDSIIDKGTL